MALWQDAPVLKVSPGSYVRPYLVLLLQPLFILSCLYPYFTPLYLSSPPPFLSCLLLLQAIFLRGLVSVCLCVIELTVKCLLSGKLKIVVNFFACCYIFSFSISISLFFYLSLHSCALFLSKFCAFLYWLVYWAGLNCQLAPINRGMLVGKFKSSILSLGISLKVRPLDSRYK